MSFFHLITVVLFIVHASEAAVAMPSEKSMLNIQATNGTKVPNVLFTVDAVESLKEALEIYEDERLRAEAFSTLYSIRHEGKWNVAVGYSSLYTHSTIFVECLVMELPQNVTKGRTWTLYRIFN